MIHKPYEHIRSILLLCESTAPEDILNLVYICEQFGLNEVL